MRLPNSLEHGGGDKMDEDGDLSLIDDDPLTYFLTPAPAFDDDDDDQDAAMMDFDFDAGIEDAKHPPQIVRSVSPSSLDGLALPPPRPPTPPRSPPARLSPDPESTTDEDDDEEYIRFGTGRLHTLGIPFTLRDFATLKARKAAKSKAAAAVATTTSLVPPPSPPSALHAPTAISARGRPAARFGSSPLGPRYGGGGGGTARGRPRSFPSRRRSPRAWREPSPDVWSIEEETEEDVNSEMDRRAAAEEATVDTTDKNTPEVVTVKPKKKVRFVLPVKEDR